MKKISTFAQSGLPGNQKRYKSIGYRYSSGIVDLSSTPQQKEAHAPALNEDDDFLLKRAQADVLDHPLLVFKTGMTLEQIREQREAAAKHFKHENI